MDIVTAIEKLDVLIASIDQELRDLAEEVAVNAKSLIIHRIQSKGIGKTYSDTKIPAYLFLLDESRLDTQQAINFVKGREKAKKEEDRYVSWKEIRQAHGNQTEFVDLTYTGRMFMNVGVIKTEKNGNTYTTYIGGFDEETRKKLVWNAQRYGAFFVLNDDEKKLIDELIKKRIAALAKKYLGQ